MPRKPRDTSPTAVERRQFGDLAEPIAYLRRGCHQTVAPFDGAFRVGDGAAVVILSADGILARAEREREIRATRSVSQRANWKRPGFRAIQSAGHAAAKA